MAAKILLFFIHIYRKWISPLKPPSCRFYPTCSEYAFEAVHTHGSIYGSWLSIKRIVKCGPWHKGGYDPVPPHKGLPHEGETH